MLVEFEVPEYQADGRFLQTEYRFEGELHRGWQIIRNGRMHLELGPGYRLLRNRYCGVCATDLARRYLPFALPQIIGHECSAIADGKTAAVEINASHKARGHSFCPYCIHGLDRHCPSRLTLGIDRLPGGFAPWVLSPENAVVTAPDGMDPIAISFVEPFAAALRALELSALDRYQSVAVLGPRRLGMLLLAALNAHREQQGLHYHIHALLRHSRLKSTCLALGADDVWLLPDPPHTPMHSLHSNFDLVFDTTGRPEGLALALNLARYEVHLKSTHGQVLTGWPNLNRFVVDELAMAQIYSDWRIPIPLPRQLAVWMDRSLPSRVVQHVKKRLSGARIEQGEQPIAAADHRWELGIAGYDVIVIPTAKQLDAFLTPGLNTIRPGGLILVAAEASADPPLDAVMARKNMRISSSRCGQFVSVFNIWQEQQKWPTLLQRLWLSETLPLSQLAKAFDVAANSQTSIKIVIDTDM